MSDDEAPIQTGGNQPDQPRPFQFLQQFRPSSPGITLCSLLLTMFNIVLVLIGIVVTLIGITAQNKISSYSVLIGKENSSKAGLAMIISGVACSVIGIVSHIGQKYQSKWILRFTTILLLFVFIAVMIAATAAVTYHGKIEIIFKKGMNDSIAAANWNTSTLKPNTQMTVMSQFQREIGCCGLASYKDWGTLNSAFKGDPPQVPVSCCKGEVCGRVDNGIVLISGGDTSKIHTNGCFQSVFDFMSENVTAILIGCYSLGVFQLVGIVFSICLMKAIAAVEPAYTTYAVF